MSDRTFLFPVDDRKSTEKAFLWFINTFVQSRDVIVVLHVIKPIGDVVEELGYSVFSSYPVPSRGLVMDNRIAAARKICSTYLEYAHVRGLTGVRGSISTHLKVEEAILNSAIANKATTIVIATRGLGRWRLFLGNSVSGYVSKHSTIPMLIIPPFKEPRRKSQIYMK
nr:universal stress protein [Hymenolepis microstoma]